MIKRCIVSAFTHLRKTAVLKPIFRHNFIKGCAAFSALLAPSVANAQLTSSNWYGTSDFTAKAFNECNSVYKITYKCQKDGKIALFKDGVNINLENAVIADDITDLEWFKGTEAVNNVYPYAVWLKEGDVEKNVTLYLIAGSLKDTISYTAPTYTTIGINGVGYQQMGLSSTPSFSASFCGVGQATQPTGATFQWQKYNASTLAWEAIPGANEATYNAGAGELEDKTQIRVVMTADGKAIESASLQVTYSEPGVDIVLEGTEVFETVQKPVYENEIDYGKSFTIRPEAKGASVLKGGYEVYTRSTDKDTDWKLFKKVEDSSPFTIAPVENLEYKIVAQCEDMRPGHEDEIVDGEETVFVRVRFSWDEGAKVDTLFFDDFGHFPAVNEYTSFDGEHYIDELSTVGGDSYKIENYWAADYFESVRNHKFALLDPLVGPYSGDCKDNNYKHYVCWDDGKCDGYRIEDGYYAIVPNPDYSNCGRSDKDYWNGYDHTDPTGSTLGGMLFVNCDAESKETVIIEREITLKNECENTRLLFSAYVNNATAKAQNHPVNVRLIVRDAEDKVVYEAPSGNIYPRTLKGGQWANLSFMFNAAKGGMYKVQLVNNQTGGNDYGNDLLFDDILIIAAYPTVEVFRDRLKTDATPIDTCEEADVALYLLNKDDIKKYITEPHYLYQYSKDSINWVNMGAIGEDDNFLVPLKKDPAYKLYWDTTYFRGIVASNEKVIEKILAGNLPVLSCDSVYAISNPFRVIFDYSGPVSEDINQSLCVGDELKIELSDYGRPKYRFVDSKTGEVIKNMDTKFSYTVKETDPADTTFLYILEQRLGCTDTVKINVHRKLLVDFEVPEPFITCLYDSPAEITDITPATGVSFTWASSDYTATTKVPSLIIPQSLPTTGVMYVRGEAEDYCGVTKQFNYHIHEPVQVELLAERNDNLFCLDADNAKLTLTANTVKGEPKTYYWMKNETQVGITLAPVNSFSFGELSEGSHVFWVKVADSVCNKPGVSEFEVKLPVEVREPISIVLSADEAVCENAPASAKVVLSHALVPDTTVIKWNVVSTNAVFAVAESKADANGVGTNSVVPVYPAVLPSTENILLQASVFDRVCSTNAPVAKTSISLHKLLDITVTPENSHDGLYCMNSNNPVITFTATVNRGEVAKYDWFNGEVGVASTKGNENSYSFNVDTEGSHVYSVKASDGVCNVAGSSSEVVKSFPTQVRKPVEMKLVADENVCEGAVTTASVELTHLLNPAGTAVDWSVVAGNGSFALPSTLTLIDQTSTNKFTPVSTDGNNKTEVVTIQAKVTDEVCLDNMVKKTFSLNLYKPIELELVTDRNDGLFCMEKNPTINFTVNTLKGEVKDYYWFADDKIIETNKSNTFAFSVTDEGKHQYKVYATDGVCNVLGTNAAFAAKDIETRLPIKATLSGDPSFCENGTLNVSATFEHVLYDGMSVAWTANTENITFGQAFTKVSNNVTSAVVKPVSKTNFLETISLKVGYIDEVCGSKTDLTYSDNFTADLHKKISIDLTAQGVVDNRLCLTKNVDNNVNYAITVNRGNPEYYVWSDEFKSTDEKRVITLVPGANVYSVNAYDAVCDADGAIASASETVNARYPLELALDLTGGKNPACMGEAVSYTLSVVDPNALGDVILYAWNPNKSTTNQVTYNSLTDLVVGANAITASAIADNGICDAKSENTTLVIQDSVVISLEVPESLCQMQDASESITLVAHVLGGKPQAFKWSTGDVTEGNSLVVNPTATTLYSVQALDEVCSNSIVVEAAHPVEVSNMFTLEVSALSHEVQMGTAANLNSSVLEDPNSTMNVAWVLTNEYGVITPVGSVPVGPFQNVINENGTYQYYAVADGGHCGLVNSNVITIDVADFYNVPTAFTPYNANPRNNIFMKGYGVEIFNRYQQLVFEGPDGWDGMYGGQLAEPGTYFYKIIKKDGRVLKGTIELVKF